MRIHREIPARCSSRSDSSASLILAAVEPKTIVVLEGDQTGQELLEESLRVLTPGVIGLDIDLPRFDLSLEHRRATSNGVVHEAAAAIREHGLGLKAATVTPEARDDVGSPNRILREEIGGKVIVRTGRRIPGVVPFGGVHAPISVVRMAVGDAYGAKEWREGEGDAEVAFRTERIERHVCRAVAEFAFREAERTGAKVFGGPKFTVSPTYEGMLKEEMDAAAARYPSVPYEPQLIDATFALLVASTGDPLVIPALNRDGDILSDLVLPLFGSIAGSESMLVAFEGDNLEPTALMAEAAHGTAPSLQGKNMANPMAMILAAAALLSQSEVGRHGRARDPRGGPRSGRAGDEDGRPGRRRLDDGVHRRGDPPDPDEARGLGLALVEHALSPSPHAEEPDGADDEQDDHRVEPVLADRLRNRLAGPVGEQRDARCPDDPARGIPGEELPPLHVAETGEPRGGDPQDGDKASEEDRFRAVLLEEPLARRKRLLGVPAREVPPVDQRTAAEPAERVADVVSDDRSKRRDYDHREQRVLVVLRVREHRRGDQHGLAGDRDTRGLHSYEHEEEDEPVVEEELRHAPSSLGGLDPRRRRPVVAPRCDSVALG